MNCVDKSNPKDDAYPHLCFFIEEALIAQFFPLLQRGFMVKAHVGCSVKRFLHEEIGLSLETVENIQSIFLDGRPVDDLDSAIIKDGSSLALSAAMPGLVGATLRRGGVYSSFRSSITHNETGAQCVSGEGFVQVKLFNLLMGELGRDFLRRGIYISSSDVKDFLIGQSVDFWQACRSIVLDGKPVEEGSLKDIAWLSRHDQVHLSVAIQK